MYNFTNQVYNDEIKRVIFRYNILHVYNNNFTVIVIYIMYKNLDIGLLHKKKQ